MPVKKKTTKNDAPATGRVTIDGTVDGLRVPSRIFEETIQKAVADGATRLTINARGQHGIGGRIWPRGKKISITVEGTAGQRLGSKGMEGTEILVKGSASDDTGWINCGAEITVLGDVTNGAHNAAARGFLYVQGGGGARCDTMTKHNPRFEPPESWYLRDVGDSFAEFKAGGIAVVCGVNPRHPDTVLGYRPCVGMVGGTIYFRGPIGKYSAGDVHIEELSEADWKWLTAGLSRFLKKIKSENHYEELSSDRTQWKKIIAWTPAERSKRARKRRPMADFREKSWDDAVGKGGIFGPYITHERTTLPYVTTGDNRRLKPVWANEKHLPPCAYNCPSKIPSHKRATLIRQGKTKEALELVLKYSPLPATVCGEVCPNLCMSSCTRAQVDRPLNIKEYGRLALELEAPKPAAPTGNTIGIIGAGPAGLSAAWQLALKGHKVNLYEAENVIGGKIQLAIPHDRLPQSVLKKELSRFQEIGVTIHSGNRVTSKLYSKIYKDNDFVVVACGAHQPRIIPFPGHKDVLSAIDFLKGINFGSIPNLKGQTVVIIGAGNVGMDVALQAYSSGAKKVYAVDVQKPAAFGKELEMATALGTEVLWPRVTESYDKSKKTILFKDGTSLKADTVIMSIGEVPLLDFLPPAIHMTHGNWIAVNEFFQTSDPKVYAIGDATRPGLVTHAIGQGRIAADVIHAELSHFDYLPEPNMLIPYERIKREYYDICRDTVFSAEGEAHVCMSCGSCRDCHMCEYTCYHGAITRVESGDGRFEYVVDKNKCIACGFCAGICPCGVWEMRENI